MNTRTMKPGAAAAFTMVALAGVLSFAAVSSGSVQHADRGAQGSAQQRVKLTASDAAAFDWFGSSVAVSGEVAVIGVRYDDDDGGGSGSAYIFNSSTGVELFKLTASDAAQGDLFGRSVAVSGDRAVVGVFSDDDDGSGSGSAYVFDSGTGAELFKLTASDAAAGDHLGASVAYSGGRVVVGADGNDDGGDFSGSAYVFDISTGAELFKLTASDAAANDLFGFSVAVSGDRAVIGAYADDDDGDRSGSAYVFDTTTGLELFKLTASDAAEDDSFGISVSVSGDRAVVGAYKDNNGGGIESGSAYVFDISTGVELFKLTANDAVGGEQFGRSVAVSGDRIVVGASHDNDGGGIDFGSAYVFDGSTGEELFKFTPSDAAAGDRFGFAVAVSGERAVIGAHYDDDGGSASGSAYVFSLAACPADLNGDGVIDTADLGILIGNFGFNTTADRGDINGDGIVDTADLGLLIAGFGKGCG